MNNRKMLHYDRIHVSEGSDVIKKSESTECNICHYWHFRFKQMSAIDAMI